MKNLKEYDKLDWLSISMATYAKEVKNSSEFEKLIVARADAQFLDQGARSILIKKSFAQIKEIKYSFTGNNFSNAEYSISVATADELAKDIITGALIYNERGDNGYKILTQPCIDKLKNGLLTVNNWIKKNAPQNSSSNPNYNMNSSKVSQEIRRFRTTFKPNK